MGNCVKPAGASRIPWRFAHRASAGMAVSLAGLQRTITAGVAIVSRRENKIVSLARRALAEGPLSTNALLSYLTNAGVRAVDPGELWEVLTTRNVAESDGSLFRLVGTGPPADPNPRDQSGPGPAMAQSPSEPPTATADAFPAVQRELRMLRSGLGLSEVTGERTVATDRVWCERAEEMASAVRVELADAARRVALKDVHVVNGVVVGRTRLSAVVRFTCEDEMPVGEGAAVLFLPGDAGAGYEPVQAEVLAVFGHEVTVTLPFHSECTGSGRLRCDLTWLLKRQADRLVETSRGARGFNPSAASALGESVRATARVPSQDRHAVAAPTGLNARQAAAVERARQPGVTWIWGPPGTGKTTTVAAAVEDLTGRGLRVLLVAPTNVAVDVAFSAVLSRVTVRALGKFVRLGPAVDRRMADRTDGAVLVDEVAAERGSQVAQRLQQVSRETAERRSRLKELEAVARRRALSDSQQQERTRLEHRLAELAELRRGLDDLLQQVRRQVCREAQLVAATVYQVMLNTIQGLPFDAVIIEEASMVPASLGRF